MGQAQTVAGAGAAGAQQIELAVLGWDWLPLGNPATQQAHICSICDITLLRVGSTSRVYIAAVDAARVVGQQHDLPLAAQAVTLRVNASIAVHVFTTERSYMQVDCTVYQPCSCEKSLTAAY